jgi:hypothetical protein
MPGIPQIVTTKSSLAKLLWTVLHSVSSTLHTQSLTFTSFLRSQTENVIDEVLFGTLNRTSSGVNGEKMKKLNSIIGDLKSITKKSYGPHCSKYDTPDKIGIAADKKMNRKRPLLQSLDNRVPKRSSSSIVIGIPFVFFFNLFYF